MEKTYSKETIFTGCIDISQGGPVAGHSGSGCQEVVFDFENNVVIAYITNGLKIGMYDGCRPYARLQKAVYDVVGICLFGKIIANGSKPDFIN
ncbi:unnamed protein product [Strongylus vulgaris]|uniref:Beta-lactamase-related domain-containing protein n=1 Tax=Strongylus vulgaris TaxID=40348 RepID=A0A3P7IJD8_STRVU|nr:unnamed protein product [Strongylus vulgaris]